MSCEDAVPISMCGKDARLVCAFVEQEFQIWQLMDEMQIAGL
jgi:hypothetical protein